MCISNNTLRAASQPTMDGIHESMFGHMRVPSIRRSCPLNAAPRVVSFSTTVIDKESAGMVDGSKTTKLSGEDLKQETDRLLAALETYGKADSAAESLHVNLVEFDRVLEKWSMQAEIDGIEAADSADALLIALEHAMVRLASDNTFMRWNVAWYNNVMHAYAVCSGGRAAAEKAETILDSMLMSCHEYKSDKMSSVPPEPTTRSFNIVINAWAKSGEQDSGERAECIFTRMETWFLECRNRPEFHGAAPNARTLSGVLDAWAQSGAKGAEERVLGILMHAIGKRRGYMQKLREEGPHVGEMAIKPNVIMFNSAIHAWVNSGRGHYGAERAEEILRMMERLNETEELGEIDVNDEDDVGLKPNTRTLTLLIDAWAECENIDKTGEAAKRAENILVLMEKLFREGQDVKPTYMSFTSCITAWSRSVRTHDAAERAEALLDRLLALYRETGDEDMKPTVFTGNAVISAWAKSRHELSAERAEDVFQRLCEFCEPDTYSYNSLINAYAKKGHALMAKKLLKQMEDSFDNGNTTVRPDKVTFNTVIYALSKSSLQGSAEEAEALLERMEAMYKEGRAELKPTPTTYTTVINAWANSRDPRKATRARKILNTMIEGYKAGDVNLKPDVKAFTSVISACSRIDLKHADQIRSALRLAIQTFEEMKNSPEYDEANSVTYLAVVKACSHLSTDPAERSRVSRSIFQRCCHEGMVSKQFLDMLKRAVPHEDLVALNVEGTIPYEWSRNVPRRDRPRSS